MDLYRKAKWMCERPAAGARRRRLGISRTTGLRWRQLMDHSDRQRAPAPGAAAAAHCREQIATAIQDARRAA